MSAVERLADEYWAFHVATEQLRNIECGRLDQIERWEDLSAAGAAERVDRLLAFAARADLVAPGDAEEAATLAVIAEDARATAAMLPWTRDRTFVCAPIGLPLLLPISLPRYPLSSAAHGDGYVAKLAGFGGFVDGWIDGIREGLAHDRRTPARGVAGSIAAIERLLDPSTPEPLLTQPAPTELTAAESDEWRGRVAHAIDEHVRPAFGRFAAFLRDEVLPTAQPDDAPGLCHLRDGDTAYASLLRAMTGSDHTADELHQLGLDILQRLDDEYRVLGREAFGVSDPAEVRRLARESRAVELTDPAAVLRHAESILERAQSVAPQWFDRLPRAGCEAVAVDGGPTAFYGEPSADGARGGTLFFNTADPSAWGVELETVVFHESIPGHHLQIALAMELGLHPVRSELISMSYAEGWGLYSERLADEMGLYSSPLTRIGMVSCDSWRACRLVVDTGIHAKGWTRQQAIEFLDDHAVMHRSTGENEIDRYVAWPAQATAYMVGRVEIDRLRRTAEAALGSAFDVRAFHDAVLGGGALPLGTLARRVESWIAASAQP